MSELYKSDIFFFVTTIAVVVLTILLTVLIVYIVKIAHDIKYISKKAKHEADLISADIAGLRDNVKGKAQHIQTLLGFLSNFTNKKK